MSKKFVIGIIAVTLMLAFIPALSLATSTEVELNNENLVQA